MKRVDISAWGVIEERDNTGYNNMRRIVYQINSTDKKHKTIKCYINNNLQLKMCFLA